jgi:hypothetical protein
MKEVCIMKKKRMTAVAASLLISAVMAGEALAASGFWVVVGGGWKYLNYDGGYTCSTWIDDGGTYYRTDENGLMLTGWFQDVNDGGRWYYLQPEEGAPQGSMKTGWLLKDGKWYFFDTRVGGPRGAMLTGWQWIDGKCYYLDPADGGAMAVSGTTPDGYTVDASGAWVDASGNQHYEAGRGISSTQTFDMEGNPVGTENGAGPDGNNRTEVYVDNEDTNSGGGGSGSSESSYSSDRSVSHAANDARTGNYGMMSADEKADVDDAISDFMDEYITDDMSDLAKEIKIIEWLVENCKYRSEDGWECATAYSCIVNGEAQCAGYADAFLQTAKACGLDVRYVYNNFHAWNIVKIDGDWYHVDVTFEDPLGNNGYGFGNLRNKYINLTDSEIRKERSHETWSPDSIKCNSWKYGSDSVRYYLNTGKTLRSSEVDEAEDADFNEEVEKYDEIYQSYVDDGAIVATREYDTHDIIPDMCEERRENFVILFDLASGINEESTIQRVERCDGVESCSLTVEKKFRYVDGKRKNYLILTFEVSYI